jgi:hypothetical protein
MVSHHHEKGEKGSTGPSFMSEARGGHGGVEPNRCTLENPLFSPSSNDGKNEKPKSEEFLDSEVPNLGERVRF